MYVRWKKRAMTKGKRPSGKTALTAVVVENRWVDGRPQQRHVAYLSTIRADLAKQASEQLYFWHNAEPRLAALGLDPADRARIENKIGEVVPRPSDEAIQQARERLAKLESHRRR